MESMIFYRSFRDALKKCDPADALAAYEAILDYGLDGIEPKDLAPVPALIFDLVKPQIDANSRRRASGKRGGRPHAEEKTNGYTDEKPMVFEKCANKKPMVSENCAKEKPMVSDLHANKKPNVNVNDNDNDNENVNVNVNDRGNRAKRASTFAPPTLTEVREYCKERNNKVDPERFVDFYEAKGWMVGKNKMKDWRACVRTWEKTEEKARSGTTDKEKNYIRQTYDIAALEGVLVKNV